MPGAIDIVINLHTPEVLPFKPKWRREFFEGKIGDDDEILVWHTPVLDTAIHRQANERHTENRIRL